MRVFLEDHCILQQVGNEAVLLNLQSGQYFELNETGTALLEAIQKQADLQLAQTMVLQQFNVDAKTLANDVDALLRHLRDYQLVRTEG